jgi:lysophospholipase L1-like esterase
MKNSVLLIFLILYVPVCFASSDNELFEPQSVDTLWYVWTEYEGKNLDIFSSKWNGAEWTSPFRLTDNISYNTTPSVALNKDKNPWVTWTGYDGIKTSIYARYFDGKIWSKAIQVDDVDIYSDNNPSIVVDDTNTPWITWVGSNGKNDDIYVSNWDGKNWAYPVKINSENPVPHIMPIISIDKNNNPIIVWYSYETDKYKLFFSQRLKDRWTEEKYVAEKNDRSSINMPHIIKKGNGELELLWNEKNTHYKSMWDGEKWSLPVETNIPILPKNFLKKQPVGSGHITWLENNLIKSIKILEPVSKKILIVKNADHSSSLFAWFKNNIDPALYAAVEDNKYIAFGDSITYGYGGTNDIGYPPKLETLLNNKIGPSIVVNEGSPGERTDQGLMRVDSVLANNNARFILIMEGTNDVTNADSPETVAFNLREICKHAIDYGTTPLLATLTPRLDFLDYYVREDYNPAIVAVAKELNITLVDQYTKMSTDTARYMADGRLHPNDDGYALIAEIWFDAINNILNPPREDTSNNAGCGAVPPIYKNKNSNGLYNNLIPSGLLFAFILLIKHFLHRKLFYKN